MSKHNNPSISERARRIFNNQLNEEISNEVLDYITPTIEIKPRVNIGKYSSLTNSLGGTIYTTPTDKDFYLTFCCLGVIKDVTATSVESYLSAVIDGVRVYILDIPGITLTPQDQTLCVSFPLPIKIDRGTTININSSTNVANTRVFGSILGYTEEVKNPSLL